MVIWHGLSQPNIFIFSEMHDLHVSNATCFMSLYDLARFMFEGKPKKLWRHFETTPMYVSTRKNDLRDPGSCSMFLYGCKGCMPLMGR